MGNWTEHTIVVTRQAEDLMERLDEVLQEADESDSQIENGTATIRLSYDSYDEEKESSLVTALRESAQEGMEATWFRFSDDAVFTALDVFEEGNRYTTVLSVDRLIRDMDLALLYAKVENGEESPETLGEAFAGMVTDPDAPEEVEEAFAIAELLKKHSVRPSEDQEENWIQVFDALLASSETLDKDELDDWKVETLEWIEIVRDSLANGRTRKTYGLDFLSQSEPVERLLNTCLSVIPSLSEKEKLLLVDAMREFNDGCSSCIVWSPMDVDLHDMYGLTEEEKREAISRFVRGQECSDFDWTDIDMHASDVVSERNPKVDEIHEFVVKALSRVEEKKAKKTKKSKKSGR